MKRNPWFLLIAFFVVLIIIRVWLTLMASKTSVSKPATVPSQIAATFNCQNGTYIQANFFNDPPRHVDLTLSNGKNLSLFQTISADGARYANPGETFVFWNKGDTAFIEENGVRTFDNCQTNTNNSPTPTLTSTITAAPTQVATTLANPASVNCTQKGGQVQILTRPDGGQYGICYFEDNYACEEWALLHGDCPLGGRRTTGFDTIAQKFCAWSGGQTFAQDNAVCTFKDGSTCPDDAFYAGTCQKGTKTK